MNRGHARHDPVRERIEACQAPVIEPGAIAAIQGHPDRIEAPDHNLGVVGIFSLDEVEKNTGIHWCQTDAAMRGWRTKTARDAAAMKKIECGMGALSHSRE